MCDTSGNQDKLTYKIEGRRIVRKRKDLGVFQCKNVLSVDVSCPYTLIFK